MKRNPFDVGRYDVIIIGAGIGGLVCGNYLAKAGLKVLIIEQHHKVGGYCSSFRHGPFIFDTGVHELTHCGENGVLGNIIRELRIDNKICIKRFPEADIIMTNGYVITIKMDYSETRRQLEYHFPREKGRIKEFFNLFKKPIFFQSYNKLKDRSFKELLDEYFTNERLKNFWYTMCCGMGVSPSKLSAIAGFAYCRTIIMDSGYYPLGGMQTFPNALLDTFKGFGGEIILSKKVTNIDIKDRGVVSVNVAAGLSFYTNYAVSTCDPIQTYFMMIGKEHLDLKFIHRINNIVTFPSSFIVFLGLNSPLERNVSKGLATIYYNESLPGKRYDVINHFDPFLKDMVFVPSSINDPSLAPKDGESIYLFKIAPYKNKKYWDNNKFLIAEKTIDNAEALIPNLRRYIAHKEIATPHTLYKYTLNYRGASKGWGSVFSTTGLKMMDFSSHIKGLFVAGHWAPSPVGNGGISMAAYSGFQTAKQIKHVFKGKTI